MEFPLTSAQIAELLHLPEENVAANWPLIQNGLGAFNLTGTLTQIAAIATVRIECPPFKPRTELYDGDPETYFARYDGRKDLGNVEPGDGYKFRGRGFIQITGRANYAHYSKALGVDLIACPDYALEPALSGVVLGAFFAERKVDARAEVQDWIGVRRAVNGGLNGMSEFMVCVNRLMAALPK